MYMCNKRLVPFSSISWLTKLWRGPAPAYLLIKARRLAKYAMKLSTVTAPMKWSTFDNKEVTTSSRNWFYQEEWSSHLLSWHIKKACWHCKVVLCILCKGQTKLRKHKRPCLSEKVPLRGARDHPNVINRIVWAEALQPLALVNCMFLFLFSFSYLYLYLHLFLYLYLYFYVNRIVRTGTLQVAMACTRSENCTAFAFVFVFVFHDRIVQVVPETLHCNILSTKNQIWELHYEAENGPLLWANKKIFYSSVSIAVDL